jgi:hypothetical protein
MEAKLGFITNSGSKMFFLIIATLNPWKTYIKKGHFGHLVFCRFLQISADFHRFPQISTDFCRFLQIWGGFSTQTVSFSS